MACAPQAAELHVTRVWHIATQSPGLQGMSIWHTSWRPQGLGPIRSTRLKVWCTMMHYEVIWSNTKQWKVIAECMAYVLAAYKSPLVIACHLLIYSRPVCYGGMAYACKLWNCMQWQRTLCVTSSETACNDGLAYASKATELHVARPWHMLAQAPEPHVMRAQYMAQGPKYIGTVWPIRLRVHHNRK